MDAQSQKIKSLVNGDPRPSSTSFLSQDQRDILRIFLRNRLSVLGLVIVVFWIVVAIVGPTLAPLPPQEMDIMNRRSPPNASRPLGTDWLGRDVFSRLLHGAPITLMIGVVPIAIAIVIGVPTGAIAGYFGGRVETLIMRTADIFLSVPALVLAIAVTAALGPSLLNAMIAVSVVWWPWYTRLIHSQTLIPLEACFCRGCNGIGSQSPNYHRPAPFTQYGFVYLCERLLRPGLCRSDYGGFGIHRHGRAGSKSRMGVGRQSRSSLYARVLVDICIPWRGHFQRGAWIQSVGRWDPRCIRSRNQGALTKMAQQSPLLEVKNLHVRFETLRGVLQAVNGVDLTIYPGQIVGLIGESGSGKSVTAKSILNVLSTPPGITEGEIWYRGQNLLELSARAMSKIRGQRIAMVSQDPMSSLNPVFTVGEQLRDALLWADVVQNTTKEPSAWNLVNRFTQAGRRRFRQAAAQAVDGLRQVELPAPQQQVKNFPHQLSGGMRQRVLTAMAWAGGPDLIIADEPTTALDVTIQAQILMLLQELVQTRGASILYISHDLGVVAQLCDRVAVMYAGEIVEEANVLEIFENPQHPYTEALIQATTMASEEDLVEIPGEVPNMLAPPTGCHFWPRCPKMVEQCTSEKPRLAKVGQDHDSKCGKVHGEWM